MRISILGAGNAGCAIAADLSSKGHEVTLIKTSHTMHEDNFSFLEQNDNRMTLDEFGVITTSRIHKISRDVTDIEEADIIIIYIQTGFHRQLIKRIAPHIQDNQLILINPGYLSSAYVLKYCSDKDVIIAEAESSFLDGRITNPGLFKVGFRNVRNPVGIYPNSRKQEAITILDNLGENIVYLESVVEAALHNPNLIVHTVGSIMSVPRIEIAKSDFCMYHEAYSRENIATWRILESLDSEKMSVLTKLGLEPLSYIDACKYRNSLDDNIDAKEVFLEYAEMDERAKGPVKVDSRYISEDVPQGLVMLESLGKMLNTATPVTTALIELASAALGRNLRVEGRTIERLGRESIERLLNDCERIRNEKNGF